MSDKALTFDSLPQLISTLIEEVAQLKQLILQHMDKPQQKEDNLIDIDEACNILRRKKSTIYHLVRDGELPHYKTGKLLEFRPSELYAWQNSYAANRSKTTEQILSKMNATVKKHPKSGWR